MQIRLFSNDIIKAYQLKFIYSEKASKFCEIFTLLLFYVVSVKSKVKILQNFVALLEYMNFKIAKHCWALAINFSVQLIVFLD